MTGDSICVRVDLWPPGDDQPGTELLPSYHAPIHNPYWDAVRGDVRPGHFSWEGPMVGCPFVRDMSKPVRDRLSWEEPRLDRHDFVRRYAWSITDPAAVQFVATYSRCRLLDPMAGTGYWAYLLRQLGIDVVCCDASPGENKWHKGAALWVPVPQNWAEVAVDEHPDRVLFLSWPPYGEPSAWRTLREFKGDRLIYIGEGEGGCTGDDDFHKLLDNEWHEVTWHRPVQWWGLHDVITVYERGRVDD